MINKVEKADSEQQRQLAIMTEESASISKRQLLIDWVTQLLILKDAPIGQLEKPQKAIAITESSVWPGMGAVLQHVLVLAE